MTKVSLKPEKREQSFLMVFTQERKGIHCKWRVLDMKSPICSLCYYNHIIMPVHSGLDWNDFILQRACWHSNDMTDWHNVYSSQILIMNTCLVQRAWVTLESVILVIYITRNLHERTNMKPPNSASPNIKLRELSEEHIAVFNKHTKQQFNMIQCWESLCSDFTSLLWQSFDLVLSRD